MVAEIGGLVADLEHILARLVRGGEGEDRIAEASTVPTGPTCTRPIGLNLYITMQRDTHRRSRPETRPVSLPTAGECFASSWAAGSVSSRSWGRTSE